MVDRMSGNELAALREYVTAPGKSLGANQADSTVLLHVTHSNLQSSFIEIRFDQHATIDAVKAKLATHCGSNPSAMQLQLKDESGAAVAVLADGARKLGYYAPKNGFTLHVVDLDPTSISRDGALEDLSQVPKYVMSEEEYAKRGNTYRKFKQERLAADPTWSLQKEMDERREAGVGGAAAAGRPRVEDPEHLAAEAAAIGVGQRCQVSPGEKRGSVRYVGKVAGLPAGYWVGVQYDEPVGKNDGAVKGRRYFECGMNYGGFVRPDKVVVGDFPELDLLGSDDEL